MSENARNLCQLCGSRSAIRVRMRDATGSFNTVYMNLCQKSFGEEALDLISGSPDGTIHLIGWNQARMDCGGFCRVPEKNTDYVGKVYEVKFGDGSDRILYCLTDSPSSALKLALVMLDDEFDKYLKIEVNEV